MIVVRNASLEDAERILEIYDYYVKNTAITFEYDTPSLHEFQKRMEKTMQRYPYLVILKDGRLEGYAYAGAFVGRAAYDWSPQRCPSPPRVCLRAKPRPTARSVVRIATDATLCLNCCMAYNFAFWCKRLFLGTYLNGYP